jgi:hypothetical protein
MRVTVGTTATLIAAGSTGTLPDRVALLVKLKSTATASVFLEVRGSNGNNTDATAAAGYELEAGQTFGIDLSPGDRLTGIVTAGTQELHVIRSGA